MYILSRVPLRINFAVMNAEEIKSRFVESTKVKSKIAQDDELIKKILIIANDIVKTLKNRNKVMICRNSGNAAAARHIATEFLNIGGIIE